MTWNEVRLATLQKMFSSEGPVISQNDEAVQQYLEAMPQAANEAVELLCAAGHGLRVSKALALPGSPVYSRLDLHEELPELYPGDPLCLYRHTPGGQDLPLTGARLTAGRYLSLPPSGSDTLLAVYTKRPAPFGSATPDNTPVELPPEAVVLLPLYMASQLYKDDDITIATQYRNEFEAALERLPKGFAGLEGGDFTSVTGWV